MEHGFKTIRGDSGTPLLSQQGIYYYIVGIHRSSSVSSSKGIKYWSVKINRNVMERLASFEKEMRKGEHALTDLFVEGSVEKLPFSKEVFQESKL